MRTGCTAEEGDFSGWRAALLKNDLVSLVAVPDIGGRIMAYDLDGYPFLFVDRNLAGQLFTPEENMGDGSLASWKNYGGDKTWPAPQGWDSDDQWHGPPDPVLDTGRYLLDLLESDGNTATVRMVSPTGSPTGIMIVRQATIRAGSSRVHLDLRFRNVADRPVRWSVWDVVQLRAERLDDNGRLAPDEECVVTAPINPRSRFLRGFQVMFGDPLNPQWDLDAARGLFVGNYRWQIGKVGLDTRGGWAAFANKTAGYAFVARFPVYPDEEYPDDGADVEFWTVGRGRVANLDYEHTDIYLMELEVLSPLRHLNPGEETSFRVEWGACRCPGPVVAVAEAGCAGEVLSAVRHGDRVRLTGAFGVFDRGNLEAVWMDSAGDEVSRTDIGSVSPLSAVLLDRAELVPWRAESVELTVSTSEGRQRLARARLLKQE